MTKTSVPWSVAATATLHCLTGCAIGEVLGMVIGTATGMSNAATVVLSIALAFVFGYALTMRGVLASGVGFTQALKVALAADTVSIAVMEIVDDAVVVAVPGAMDAGLTTPCSGLPRVLAGRRVPGDDAGEPVDDRPQARAAVVHHHH